MLKGEETARTPVRPGGENNNNLFSLHLALAAGFRYLERARVCECGSADGGETATAD